MNNQRVTYEELNLHKDWKRRQKEPQDSKSSDAVTEQEITYAELNFQNTCQDPQGNDQQHHSREALPEKFIAGSLVLLCLVWMVIIIIVIPSTKNQESKNSSLVAMTQKAYHCNQCPEEWFTYSNSCYYISNEKKTWNESMMACVSKKSKLLYIDKPEEMNFLRVFNIMSWIGLGTVNLRVWPDDSSLSSNRSSVLQEMNGNCTYVDTVNKLYLCISCLENRAYVCKHQIH